MGGKDKARRPKPYLLRRRFPRRGAKFHGNEGVSGSTPEKGSAKSPGATGLFQSNRLALFQVASVTEPFMEPEVERGCRAALRRTRRRFIPTVGGRASPALRSPLFSTWWDCHAAGRGDDLPALTIVQAGRGWADRILRRDVQIVVELVEGMLDARIARVVTDIRPDL